MNAMKACLCLLICAISFFSISHASAKTLHEIKISGKTMGTTYHITVLVEDMNQALGLKEKIDSRLDRINQSMSTFLADSEISRFNAFESTEKKFSVSEDFLDVLKVANSVYQLSGGAWDGTVTPLVKLWGFGPQDSGAEEPSRQQIENTLKHVGFNRIIVYNDGFVRKKDPRVTLDLASIAKGFAVDKVTELILEQGIQNCLVEIGGEVYAAGMAIGGNPWRVGINTPDKSSPFEEVFKVVLLTGKAMATSGGYRNYIQKGSRGVSHIIHPKTGQPVENNVASVSIIADTCTFADGLATAVVVMGLDAGLELLNRLKGVAGIIIVKNPDGTFSDHYSEGFPGAGR